MTTMTRPYNHFLDEQANPIVISSTGVRHAKAWFEQTVCGKYCGDTHKWSYGGMVSLRWLGRVAQRPEANRFCKRCASNYEGVNVNA